MADTLKIGSTASASVDLIGTSYDFVELDEPTPNIHRETTRGCGASGSKLKSRQLESWTIPLTIYALGSDGNTRFDRRDTLLLELMRAVAYEVGDEESEFYDGLPRYLVRTVDNQSPGDVYQIMDWDYSGRNKRDDNKHVTMSVSLICWPGQKIPAGMDLTGLTVTNVMGGIGRVILGSDGWPVHLGGI